MAYKRAKLLKQVERQVRTVMDEMRRAQRWHEVFTAIAWSPMLLFAMAITISLRVPGLPAAVLGYAAAVMDVLTWGVLFSFPLIPIGWVARAMYDKRLDVLAGEVLRDGRAGWPQFRGAARFGPLRARVLGGGRLEVFRGLFPTYVRWLVNSALLATVVSLCWGPTALQGAPAAGLLVRLGVALVVPWILVNWRVTAMVRVSPLVIEVSVRHGPLRAGPIRGRAVRLDADARVMMGIESIDLVDRESAALVARVSRSAYGTWQGRALAMWLEEAMTPALHE